MKLNEFSAELDSKHRLPLPSTLKSKRRTYVGRNEKSRKFLTAKKKKNFKSRGKRYGKIRKKGRSGRDKRNLALKFLTLNLALLFKFNEEKKN